MKKQSHSSRSLLQSQIMATISVALVLLMVGVLALVGITARSIAASLNDEVGFTVVVSDSLSSERINALGDRLRGEPCVASVQFVSADQVLDRWTDMLGGLNDSILDSNPFLPEWHVKVKDQWLTADSLNAVTDRIAAWPDVEEASFFSDMADAIDHTRSTLTAVLLILAALLTLISFVLISNTVRLAVHSRRLSIHTMQLVGAKGSFIRRPFMTSAFLCGIIAASVASVVIMGALFYIDTFYHQIFALLTVSEIASVLVALYAIGMIICVLAAIFATNRYLRRDYDELFK